ncbi:MAG: peptide-methionine (S)-S-oxide reductase MsrA [Bacteroidales bacterium]|jgi:peptide-methionine (S)-S-oxide reductase|nr:peptide-methionine (S)-S-oxide reductase MsrA [Bacteroidales bacterium]
MKKLIILVVILVTQIITNQTKAMSNADNLDTITLGGGCFWCTEAVFQQMKGVISVVSGYCGGEISHPTYKEVSSGLTGHAEVIQLVYDKSVIGLEQILEVFFKTHNPTTLNRQGADLGTQYRSAIFYHTAVQQQIAEKVKLHLNEANIWKDSIITEITPFKTFYKAEDYHQNYFNNNPNQAYCQFVIVPKLEKFNQLFEEFKKEN